MKISKAARDLQILVIVPKTPIRVITITVDRKKVVCRWVQFIPYEWGRGSVHICMCKEVSLLLLVAYFLK